MQTIKEIRLSNGRIAVGKRKWHRIVEGITLGGNGQAYYRVTFTDGTQEIVPAAWIVDVEYG